MKTTKNAPSRQFRDLSTRSNLINMYNPVPGIGKPSVYHAVIIIFLEFFAWGLLTTPMMDVLKETFAENTLLINGVIQGIKGILSFLSAPLLGALSDIWGRKSFLVVTVFFTCSPIPIALLSPWWFFAMISISGAFAVTWSIVFAYVADITEEENRSSAYGLVSATFAASLVTSPAIGTYLSHAYGRNVVVALATGIAALDVCFILVAVPESLPECRSSTITWDQADPFASLRKVGGDPILLLLCTTVFLSYLPEAGQFSCIFFYLRHVIGFGDEKVASFIAVVGVLAIVAQTAFLTFLYQNVGNRNTVLLGLSFQLVQLLCFAFGRSEWIMWIAGIVSAMSSLTYPTISTLVSSITDKHQQGVVQGIVTGLRGLCMGFGPAIYGFIFFVFGVEIVGDSDLLPADNIQESLINESHQPEDQGLLPGPPFLFGAVSVLVAIIIALMIPSTDTISANKSYLTLPMPKRLRKWVKHYAACKSGHTESDVEYTVVTVKPSLSDNQISVGTKMNSEEENFLGGMSDEDVV